MSVTNRITIAEAARIRNVCVRTIQKWVQKGYISKEEVTAKCFVVDKDEVLRFVPNKVGRRRGS